VLRGAQAGDPRLPAYRFWDASVKTRHHAFFAIPH
jgi:hypothetical protein